MLPKLMQLWFPLFVNKPFKDTNLFPVCNCLTEMAPSHDTFNYDEIWNFAV